MEKRKEKEMSSEAIYTKEEINKLYANHINNGWSLRTLVSVAIDHATNKGLATSIKPTSIQKLIVELDKPNRFNDTKHFFNFLYQRLRNYNAVVESHEDEEMYDF